MPCQEHAYKLDVIAELLQETLSSCKLGMHDFQVYLCAPTGSSVISMGPANRKGPLALTAPKAALEAHCAAAILQAAALANELPASELALYMAVNHDDSPLLMHRLVCPCTAYVFPLACMQVFKVLMWRSVIKCCGCMQIAHALDAHR